MDFFVDYIGPFFFKTVLPEEVYFNCLWWGCTVGCGAEMWSRGAMFRTAQRVVYRTEYTFSHTQTTSLMIASSSL